MYNNASYFTNSLCFVCKILMLWSKNYCISFWNVGVKSGTNGSTQVQQLMWMWFYWQNRRLISEARVAEGVWALHPIWAVQIYGCPFLSWCPLIESLTQIWWSQLEKKICWFIQSFLPTKIFKNVLKQAFLWCSALLKALVKWRPLFISINNNGTV